MLELNKQKRGGRSTNFILKRADEDATGKSPRGRRHEQQEKLELAIEELNVKIEDKINKRGGNQKLMADINKKNEFSNAIKLSQAAVKHIKKVKEGKDISDDDPFSRRPTRVTTYWSMKTDGENNSKGATTTRLRGPQRMLQQRQEKKSTKKKRMKKTRWQITKR